MRLFRLEREFFLSSLPDYHPAPVKSDMISSFVEGLLVEEHMLHPPSVPLKNSSRGMNRMVALQRNDIPIRE